jgi:hypothetical protein
VTRDSRQLAVYTPLARRFAPHAGANLAAGVRRARAVDYAEALSAGSVPIDWNMPS